MIERFFYHPRMQSYDFGPGHPLKPLRLQRTLELLYSVIEFTPIDPGRGDPADALRVHSADYVEGVHRVSQLGEGGRRGQGAPEWAFSFGFGSSDNPPFPGIYEAALAYTAGSAAAARAVLAGAPLAFGIAGGLHHARRQEASGFCTFNDCAVACHILRERFDRVAYVDIDVHHGDGVQWIFYDDPSVLTCSIHQDPRTLYPGTGYVTETGEDYSAVNVPLAPGTTADVWIWAFKSGILPVLTEYEPQAIVLQMGTDSHFLDPLANIRNTAQEWLEAIDCVQRLGVPVVALGGGGYDMTTVPRMWTSACLQLSGLDLPASIPAPFSEQWGVETFLDQSIPGPPGSGRSLAESVVGYITEHHLSRR